MRYVCKTLFDITATGVTGHYKPTRGEFHDKSGQYINSVETWNHARNQQRNWETLQQLISLRTQITEFSDPVQVGKEWLFDFEVEVNGVYDDGTDPVGVLKSDSDGVPMLVNSDNESTAQIIVTDGANQNIWFAISE